MPPKSEVEVYSFSWPGLIGRALEYGGHKMIANGTTIQQALASVSRLPDDARRVFVIESTLGDDQSGLLSLTDGSQVAAIIRAREASLPNVLIVGVGSDLGGRADAFVPLKFDGLDALSGVIDALPETRGGKVGE